MDHRSAEPVRSLLALASISGHVQDRISGFSASAGGDGGSALERLPPPVDQEIAMPTAAPVAPHGALERAAPGEAG